MKNAKITPFTAGDRIYESAANPREVECGIGTGSELKSLHCRSEKEDRCRRSQSSPVLVKSTDKSYYPQRSADLVKHRERLSPKTLAEIKSVLCIWKDQNGHNKDQKKR